MIFSANVQGKSTSTIVTAIYLVVFSRKFSPISLGLSVLSLIRIICEPLQFHSVFNGSPIDSLYHVDRFDSLINTYKNEYTLYLHFHANVIALIFFSCIFPVQALRISEV